MTVPAEKTLAVYADSQRRARCRGRSCGRWLSWYVLAESGKQMCFDGHPSPVHVRENLAGRVIHDLPFDQNHWATCPDRGQFTKERR